MELPEHQPDNPVFRPWNKYRQVVADLLAKGFEGFWLVIRDDEILGIYPAARLALAAVSAESAETLERTLIKQLLEHEPVSTLESLKSRCTGTPFPLAKTA
jgi:hypothetical protein